jgi:hypothetical protein
MSAERERRDFVGTVNTLADLSARRRLAARAVISQESYSPARALIPSHKDATAISAPQAAMKAALSAPQIVDCVETINHLVFITNLIIRGVAWS